jgi:hypothetical protein
MLLVLIFRNPLIIVHFQISQKLLVFSGQVGGAYPRNAIRI